MVVRLPFLQAWRVSSWSIGLYHTRQQVKARFIHENELQTQTTGLLHKGRPARKSPLLYGSFIALDRSRDGYLRRPSQTFEQARNLALAVGDAQLLGQNPDDALTR